MLLIFFIQAFFIKGIFFVVQIFGLELDVVFDYICIMMLLVLDNLT